MLDAELLSRDPEKAAEAAKAYGALAARHPQKSVFALDQANMLVNAARPEEAIPLLNQPHWSRKSIGVQLRQRLNLSSAYLSLGDAVQARKQAQVAERLARAAGKGWEQETGEALLLIADRDRTLMVSGNGFLDSGRAKARGARDLVAKTELAHVDLDSIWA